MKRIVSALILASLAAPLAGCGFQPVYALSLIPL